MKRTIALSLIATATLIGAEVELEKVSIESSKLSDVSEKAKTSADLADALSKNIPSVDMNRRSGISNDILIRGQKRDNIAIEIDGTKICGACPNRMDPPVSHVLASQIDSIEVIEGPYDVETFGTMSGGLKVNTKAPAKGVHGEINFNAGSFNYRKMGATLSGGDDTVRMLISASTESSDQYKDGNGDTMAEQVVKSGAPGGNQYQPKYEDMKAYTKKSIMAKAHINVTDDQELRLGITKNKSDDVLYPNTPMDAIYDYSNIYNVGYKAEHISDTYKLADLSYYYSDVDHPMSTEYRKAPTMDPTKNTTNHMDSTMQGVKFKNEFDINSFVLTAGLDGSKRTWSGEYINNNNGASKGLSIAETTTNNRALFAKLDKSYGAFSFSIGARYDATEIKTDDPIADDNDYNALNANIFTTYNLNNENKIFLGVGQANRVPDARELYFRKGVPGTGSVMYGTPDLEQSTNTQVDLGYELTSDMMSLKVKGFYSMLSDYIYYKKSAATVANKFVNLDATVYGGEFTASFYPMDELSIDASAAYKRGTKNEALAGQEDKDLADMAPLRGTLAVNYEYSANGMATLDVEASDKWGRYDKDNGEQKLDSWSIVNFSLEHTFDKHFVIAAGVNNIFNETYARSNTYADITLIASGAGDIILLNEPGRAFYTNFTMKF